MARISYQGALEHDRYETFRHRMEWVQAGLWLLVSLGVVAVVALHPGPILLAAGTIGAIIQVCWGRMLLARHHASRQHRR
jgi:hypothetical protein